MNAGAMLAKAPLVDRLLNTLVPKPHTAIIVATV